MRKTAILVYDLSVRGGAEQVAVSLANALAETEEIHLLTLCGDRNIYPVSEKVRLAGPFTEEKRLREMRRELRPRLLRYIRENGIENVLFEGNYASFAAGGICGRTKAQTVFCDHGALVNEWEKKDIVLIRFLAAWGCRRTVTLTKSSLRAYRKRFFLPKKRLRCIYNWIDLNAPHSGSYDPASRRIISAGRFGREKGFDLLVESLAPVLRRHPEWSLDIYGDGEMRETVEKRIAEYGAEKQIHLMGMVSDLPQRYGSYAMYVLSSYREGMPLVLLEAKANHLPIVSFDILTGPREIVEDGVSGILVPPYDTEKLGAAAERLMEDQSLRQSMAEHTWDNIGKFSKETILRQWKELLR